MVQEMMVAEIMVAIPAVDNDSFPGASGSLILLHTVFRPLLEIQIHIRE
jgi:hypothetical protein